MPKAEIKTKTILRFVQFTNLTLLLFAPTRFLNYCRVWNWGHLRQYTHTGSRAWMNRVGRKVGAPRQWYIVFSIPYSTSVILQSTKIHYSRLFVNDKSLCGLLTWYYVVQSQHSRCAGKHRDKRTGPHQILAGIFVYSQINLRQIFRFSKVSLLDYFHFL